MNLSIFDQAAQQSSSSSKGGGFESSTNPTKSNNIFDQAAGIQPKQPKPVSKPKPVATSPFQTIQVTAGKLGGEVNKAISKAPSIFESIGPELKSASVKSGNLLDGLFTSVKSGAKTAFKEVAQYSISKQPTIEQKPKDWMGQIQQQINADPTVQGAKIAFDVLNGFFGQYANPAEGGFAIVSKTPYQPKNLGHKIGQELYINLDTMVATGGFSPGVNAALGNAGKVVETTLSSSKTVARLSDFIAKSLEKVGSQFKKSPLTFKDIVDVHAGRATAAQQEAYKVAQTVDPDIVKKVVSAHKASGGDDSMTVYDFIQKTINDVKSKINTAGKTGEKQLSAPVEVTPQGARDIVMSSNLKNSPAGKELIKSSIQAENQGKNLAIVVNPEGKIKTPGGTAVEVQIVDPTDKANVIEYARGDIGKAEKDLDTLLNTESYMMNNKWQSRYAARDTAKKEIEYNADQGNEEAQKQLFEVHKLEDSISDLRSSRDAKSIEAKFSSDINNDLPKYIQEYNDKFGNVLNTDNARELSADYVADRTMSAAVHEPSSELVKKIYKYRLSLPTSSPENNFVFFTAGGTGAGKTTAIEGLSETKSLMNKADIIYDNNLASYENSVGKIDQAIESGRRAIVAYVYRDPEAALQGAIQRANRMGRTVPLDKHIGTHIESAETIQKLVEHYKNNPNVEFRFIDNSGSKGTQTLASIDIVKNLKYNKDELKDKLLAQLDKSYADKQISDKIYKGFTGKAPKRDSQSVGQGSARKPEEKNVPEPARAKEPVKETSVQPTQEKPKSEFQSRVFERLQEENPQALQGELAYDPIRLKDEVAKAVELINTDKEKAFRIAMGAETSSDITSTAVNVAMSEKALMDENYSMYSRLVKNRSLAQTRRGQEIVSERGSTKDNSTSRYVKELVASRLDSLGKKYLSGLSVTKKVSQKEKAINIIDKEVAKVQKRISRTKEMDINEAQALLDSLICK